jgi:uncharacterized protein YydD (DUF2326 family)
MKNKEQCNKLNEFSLKFDEEIKNHTIKEKIVDEKNKLEKYDKDSKKYHKISKKIQEYENSILNNNKLIDANNKCNNNKFSKEQCASYLNGIQEWNNELLKYHSFVGFKGMITFSRKPMREQRKYVFELIDDFKDNCS